MELTYVVAGMTCDHCTAAVEAEVAVVPGVSAVSAEHTTKRVVVSGKEVDDAAVRAAIDEAGYEAA
ncbi:MAG: heavy-metal-associated domain-containing protein [Actinomycetota bacterium]|nr:heavy-metal-associated domain-containing protein [Actinomycetota bacterium]